MTAETPSSTNTEPPGEPEVAVVGLPWDGSSSFHRGAAQAPDRIRRAFRSPAGNPCSEDGTDLSTTMRLRDLGDLDLAPRRGSEDFSAAEVFARIERELDGTLQTGSRILALGGDHSVTYPLVKAHHRHYGGLWIVHFDAHPDLYDEFEGDRLSHACPFARIMEEGLARGLTQVGIRTATPHQRRQAERFGVAMHPPGTPAERLWNGIDGPVYLSFDLDVLDPAFAPGVSHPEPGGLSVREAIDLLRTLPGPLVGADLVELNPRRDASGLTALVAAKLFKELAARLLADGAGPPL